MKRNLIIACLLGLLAIVLGAFGAHSLKESITSEALQGFETGVRYQIYHVLVLLFVNTYAGFTEKTKNTLSLLLFIGILCFSGSLYLISAGLVSAAAIWFVTPLGGLLFILAWLLLLITFAKKNN